MFTLRYLFLQVIFICGIAFGGVYYVDKTSGNDANAGTSSSYPWKTIAKVNSHHFYAGDKILFKTGNVWYETLKIIYSGSSASPITYSKYGSGALPIINGSKVRANCVYVTGVHNVVVENLDLMNNTGSGDMRIKYSSYVEARNNHVYTTGHGGFFIEESQYITISRNIITTPSGSYAVQTDGIYSQRNTNNIYKENAIRITNSDPYQHLDGIQSYQDRDLTINSNYIKHQTLKRNAQGIYTSSGRGTHIYFNNVVDCPYTVAGVVAFNNSESTSDILKLYHNTLIGLGGNILTVSGPVYLRSENNIFIARSSNYCVINLKYGLISPIIDYNNYYNGGNYKLIVYKNDIKTITEWRAMGFDLHSKVANPQLTSSYQIPLGSPALDISVYLGELVVHDKAGHLRPRYKVDPGAYENIQNLSKEESSVTPAVFELSQNYPNPFNPSTTIKYSIPLESDVTLKVYDILGDEVATLVNTREKEGEHLIQFNASHLASGIYIYRITAGSYTQTKKMTLVK